MKTTADTARDLMTGKADNLEESLVSVNRKLISPLACTLHCPSLPK